MAYQIDKDDVLNENEFQELRTLLRGDNSRDAVLIEIALETGARSQEVLNITLGDIDLDQGTVYIRGIKGSLNRNLPISPALTKKVKRLVSKFKAPTNECRLFAIKTSRFRQIWMKKRVCSKKLHALRHTLAVRLYNASKDIKLVQKALGHKNINNTMVYLDFSYTEDHMRQYLERVHG